MQPLLSGLGFRALTRLSAWAVLALIAASTSAVAQKGTLRERLTPDVLAVVYPAGAERLGPEEGSPPAIAVYRGDKVVAYLFSTLDIVAARGYSTTPFDVIGGVDLTGHITGAKVVFHKESRISDSALNQRRLDTFLAREAGAPLSGNTDALPPDFVAGATVSARAMRAAVVVTARLVLRGRVARPAAEPAVQTRPAGIDTDSFARQSWAALVAAGAVVRRTVTSGDVADALAASGASAAKLDVPLGKRDDLYIEFATALFTPAAIGGNLVGILNFEDFKNRMPSDASAIFVASRGPYDFRGKKFFLDAEGNRFDRLRVVQDGRTFNFVQGDYQWVNPYSDGIREMQDAAIFVIPAQSGFDPAKPWRLEILVNVVYPAPVTLAFGLDYRLPDLQALTRLDDTISERRAQAPALGPAAARDSTENQVAEAPPPGTPATSVDDDEEDEIETSPWVEAWRDSEVNVAILAALLTVLTLIFGFQATLARSRPAHRIVRTSFLAVVLIWLGWTAGAQLSIVNVINYLHAPFGGLDIGFYLAEPLMVIIAGYTLISVVLIGRGVFCGWLCPFGALQELTGQLSRALGVPQWSPPAAIEKRLWLGKYIAAAAVLVLGLSTLDPSGVATEIEPFRTAISSKFTRAWPYVAYAGALLAMGLFTERAYCRFLCPLGGVLAVLDRLHLLNRLKRRPECGNPCHLCERSCPVGAIVPSGKILTAECFQCLDCQVEYYDDKRCPPSAQAAAKRRMDG
ncbi:MAG TPA: 4Fe-4S binding protein [Xanthobacteraceae bacterium]|nr:4Fe-4S binding protein [Xanthobacteraceae bacterium]